MVGISRTSAPNSASVGRDGLLPSLKFGAGLAPSPGDASRQSVFRTAGRCSDQFNFPRSLTTSPTMVSAGGTIFFSAASLAIVASVPATDFCFPSVPHWITATGVSGAMPVRDERFRPVVQIFRAHEHDLGAGNFGDLLVAQRRGRVRRIAVAGENREAGAMLAVGEGNAGVIRRGDDGRNARHDFKGNFRRRQCLRPPRRPGQKYRDRRL